jgi:hypothetical protein
MGKWFVIGPQSPLGWTPTEEVWSSPRTMTVNYATQERAIYNISTSYFTKYRRYAVSDSELIAPSFLIGHTESSPWFPTVSRGKACSPADWRSTRTELFQDQQASFVASVVGQVHVWN